jgi:hypothetical protein
MSLRFCTLLGTCLLLATVTGECSEQSVTATDGEIQPSVITYDTSRYPGQWCVVTFVRESPTLGPRRSSSLVRSTYSYAPPGIGRAVLNNGSPYAYRPSFIENIIETRFLHLMTLWQGHENELLLGIDDHGMFGVTLD